MTELLVNAFQDASEGELSFRLSYLASGEVQADVARVSGLADAIAEDMAPELFPDHRRALGDCVEAALGALWSDNAETAARAFVKRHWAARIAALTEPPRDPKSALQEWTLARRSRLPRYTLLDRQGEDHEPVFKIEVMVERDRGGAVTAQATGPTIREAEKKAAARVLEQLSRRR